MLLFILNEGSLLPKSIKKNLNKPPYLQLAIDILDLSTVHNFLSRLEPPSQNLLFEIGTPLIKNEGLKNLVPVFRDYIPDSYLIADLKTLDVGRFEVDLGARTGVDACVVSGLAPLPTIREFIKHCKEFSIDAWMDTLGTDLQQLNSKILHLNPLPDVIIVHRGIDEELSGAKSPWENITHLKSLKRCMFAAAGGITLENLKDVEKHDVDIFIVGRAVYQSENPQETINQFLSVISSNK